MLSVFGTSCVADKEDLVVVRLTQQCHVKNKFK